MVNKFNFKLHMSYWQFEGDSKQVFRALELSDGSYIVSWLNSDGTTSEVEYTSDEVTESIALGDWITTNENGE